MWCTVAIGRLTHDAPEDHPLTGKTIIKNKQKGLSACVPRYCEVLLYLNVKCKCTGVCAGLSLFIILIIAVVVSILIIVLGIFLLKR